MGKSLRVGAGLFLLFAISLIAPDTSSAVPAFARQTGMTCTSCHYQHFPLLNAFGREFKAGGYTQVGGQSLIEADMLSTPVVLNASLIAKLRYQKTNGANDDSGTNKGELQLPDEGALLIGGRAGEHVGFLLEAQLIKPEEPSFTAFRMPITYDVSGYKLSVVPFTTFEAGVSYGYELFNTGAQRMIRTFEPRDDLSAQMYIGTETAATGVAFVAKRPQWYANYTLWAPEHGTTDAGPYLSYLRAAYLPTIGNWDVGVGAQWWGGTTKYAGTNRFSADAWAIDAQAQGNLGQYPLGVYFSYASAAKTDGTENLFNDSTADDKSAFALHGELGVLPGKATVSAGVRMGKNGDGTDDSDNAVFLGASYLLAQNVQLQFNQSFYSGDAYDPEPANGDALTYLVLFAAF